MTSDEECSPCGPVVDCAAYAGGVRVLDLGIDQIGYALTRSDRFVWLGLYEPDEATLRRVQLQFDLHSLAIEDAHHAHQRPKMELYGQSVFVVLRTAHALPGARAEFGETHVFLGSNYVVTVRHGSLHSHVGLRQRCEATPELLAQGPGYVLYALMDSVVDHYLPLVERIEAEIEEVEAHIFGDPDGANPSVRIYHLKRDLLGLRRAVAPLADVCHRLMRVRVPGVTADTQLYFRDVYDHVVRLNEEIAAQGELLTSALETHLSLTSAGQSEHMKRITAWAAILAVPTMIAGIYGMNFNYMPELQWQYGYHASLVAMTLVCLALYTRFRRSGWL